MLVVVVFVGAIGIGLIFAQDPGYVKFQYQDQIVESTLAVMSLLSVIIIAGVYAAIRLLGGFVRLPESMRSWSNSRKERRAKATLNKGLQELVEGQWTKAEKHLTRYVKHGGTPSVNYLAAARAAQEQGKGKERDHYLQLAHHEADGKDVSVGLTQAELQLKSGEYEPALATLNSIRENAPKNVQAVRLLVDCYKALEDWEGLGSSVWEAQKLKAMEELESDRLLFQAFEQQLLRASAASSDTRLIDEVWKRTPQKVKRADKLLPLYLRLLIKHGETTRPEGIMVEGIKLQWNEKLVYLYGVIEGLDPVGQLRQAEKWLRRHKDSAILRLTLARLCLRNQLWAKARVYLEESIELEANAETYLLLGKLLEQLGEHDNARECYSKGLMLKVDKGLSSQVHFPAIEGSQHHADRLVAARTDNVLLNPAV